MSRGRPSTPYRQPTHLGRYLALGTAGVLGVAFLMLALGSFYTVEPDEQAVVLRFGKYHATTTPGLHGKIPLVDRVLMVSIDEQTLRLPGVEGSGDLQARQLDETETLMLTGDLNAASVEWTIQWRVTDPKDYLFAFYDFDDHQVFERVFRTAARSVMNRLVGDYSIDEVLTEKRPEVAQKAWDATQAILDDYHCGVTITGLQMQRVTPPDKVRSAFDEVNASIQERDRLENEANKERNKLLPAAKAERDKLIREAEGYSDRRIAEVDGEVQALRTKYAAYQAAPAETRRRLYLETLQNVLIGVKHKTILDSDLQGALPLLQLETGN